VHPVGKTVRRVKKMNGSFLMVSTSSIPMQSLGKIVQRAPAVGAKMWCLSVFTGRLPWQPAGIKFTQCVSGQKSAFSPLQEKLCVGSKND